MSIMYVHKLTMVEYYIHFIPKASMQYSYDVAMKTPGKYK